MKVRVSLLQDQKATNHLEAGKNHPAFQTKMEKKAPKRKKKEDKRAERGKSDEFNKRDQTKAQNLQNFVSRGLHVLRSRSTNKLPKVSPKNQKKEQPKDPRGGSKVASPPRSQAPNTSPQSPPVSDGTPQPQSLRKGSGGKGQLSPVPKKRTMSSEQSLPSRKTPAAQAKTTSDLVRPTLPSKPVQESSQEDDEIPNFDDVDGTLVVKDENDTKPNGSDDDIPDMDTDAGTLVIKQDNEKQGNGNGNNDSDIPDFDEMDGTLVIKEDEASPDKENDELEAYGDNTESGTLVITKPNPTKGAGSDSESDYYDENYGFGTLMTKEGEDSPPQSQTPPVVSKPQEPTDPGIITISKLELAKLLKTVVQRAITQHEERILALETKNRDLEKEIELLHSMVSLKDQLTPK